MKPESIQLLFIIIVFNIWQRVLNNQSYHQLCWMLQDNSKKVFESQNYVYESGGLKMFENRIKVWIKNQIIKLF